jgi:cytochrome b subunit of formate dehydrogenase
MSQSNANYKRFSLVQRLEHALMVISFTVLSITGIPQKYATTPWAETMLAWMGGLS